jgi:hypothetical protein
MKNRKIAALLVLSLLVLVSTWVLPSVVGEAQEIRPQMSLVKRVEALEQQVAYLIARVEALEGGCHTCTCDVMHLEPLSDFPGDPSDGDTCVVGESDSQHSYCYLNGDWLRLDLDLPSPIKPPPIKPSIVP